MSNELQVIVNDIYACRDAFDAARVDASMKFDTEAGFAIQIVSTNSYLLSVAQKARQSMANAVTNIAAIGLSLNPALKHAYLVPRKVSKEAGVQVCLDISYMGLIELAVSSGSLLMAQARVVHANDTYVDNGPSLAPTHKYEAFSPDRGPIVGVYVVAKLPSGDFMSETMTVDEINKIRDRSEAYKAVVEKRAKSCPWTTDWEEMAKKTVVKRASKYWPKTERLDRAIHHLNTEAGEGISEALAPTPAVTGFDCDAFIERVRAAKTDAAVMEIYLEGVALVTRFRDMEGGRRFKKAVIDRRNQIKAKADATDINFTENRRAA